MPQFIVKYRLKTDEINRPPGRGFRVVINEVDSSWGVHLEMLTSQPVGPSMRANFIGFRGNGTFEISSQLHTAIKEFWLQSAGDLVGPSIIEGAEFCELRP